MGFGKCLINPLLCAANVVKGSNSDSNSNSEADGELVCNKGLLNFIPSTSGATIIMDKVCNTNNSAFTNGDVIRVAGEVTSNVTSTVGGGLMELLFGENWLTYVRITMGILIGLIVLGVVSKIRNLLR